MAENRDPQRIPRKGDQKDREDLCGEHPFGDVGQIAAFLLFLLVWVPDL